jgi:hypothetical protein
MEFDHPDGFEVIDAAEFEAAAERLVDCRRRTVPWHNAVWQRGGFSNVRW